MLSTGIAHWVWVTCSGRCRAVASMKAWCSLEEWWIWRRETLWGWSPQRWDCSQREPLMETGSSAAAGSHIWGRATNMPLVCYSAHTAPPHFTFTTVQVCMLNSCQGNLLSVHMNSLFWKMTNIEAIDIPAQWSFSNCSDLSTCSTLCSVITEMKMGVFFNQECPVRSCTLDPETVWILTLPDPALVQVEAGNRALKAVFGGKLAAKGKSLAELLQPHSIGKLFGCLILTLHL